MAHTVLPLFPDGNCRLCGSHCTYKQEIGKADMPSGLKKEVATAATKDFSSQTVGSLENDF
jgi:hypothetical protein